MFSATTRPFTSSAIELPSNQHFSIGPDGQVFVDLTFISEPLGMPADKGDGWPTFEFDDRIGQDKRYTIVRKLGWGMHSSTWLAHDSVDKKYVAVKALTGYMTDLSNRKVTWEANALKKLSASPISPHCVQLLDQFIVTGSGSAGEHLCFVMPLYGGDVMSIFKANKKKPFPLPLVKRILLHILRGIAHAHSRGVIHTDLKSDNFFFESTLTSGDVDRCVRDDPPRRHPGEMSEDGIVSSAVSQPLPMISMDAALSATYVLGDFGCAADATIYNGHTITSPALRPPEVFLKGGWTPEADIWTFGCIIFELIIGRTLFAHRADEERNLDETESMLYQMICYICRDFSPEFLELFPVSNEYFNPDGSLKKNPKPRDVPFELLFGQYKVISHADAVQTSNLMRRCLSLYPNVRDPAAELLKDPWFKDVE